ncbi:MAG: phosphoglucosamine mutase, partial [Methanobacteriaceae archaeon]
IYYNSSYIKKNWDEVGQINTIEEVKDQYIEDLLKQVNIEKKADNSPLKVVIDCASGAGSYLSPIIFRKAGCDVLAINAQADGHFPGRNPEPNEANLGDLMKVVKVTGADIGIAHDGDADRMIAIDEEGKIGDFDKLLAIACKRYGAPVVTTVDAGMSIEECLDSSNDSETPPSTIDGTCSVIRTKVGDVNVAEEIIKVSAKFGGEPSGTWLHPDFCMCPDGILSGLILAEIVSKEGKLSKLLAEIPNYPNIREKITCTAEEKIAVMDAVNSGFENIFSNEDNSIGKVADVNKIDGVRITLEDGSWVLVRPSGTEDYVRITLESKTDEKANEILKKSADFINNILK